MSHNGCVYLYVSQILLLRFSVADISNNIRILFSLVALLYFKRSTAARDFFFFYADIGKETFLRCCAGKKRFNNLDLLKYSLSPYQQMYKKQSQFLSQT